MSRPLILCHRSHTFANMMTAAVPTATSRATARSPGAREAAAAGATTAARWATPRLSAPIHASSVSSLGPATIAAHRVIVVLSARPRSARSAVSRVSLLSTIFLRDLC